ncbi:MAG: hypothetical protein VXV97_12395 [Pseudomonadota bacterium]|nr:hypothetical protein [Pseudomonadota bacterium]
MLRNSEIHDVVWPRAARQMEIAPVAPRLNTLEGKTVAQLWDYLFRGDEVFDHLEAGLKERYPSIKFVCWKDFGSTHGTVERQILADLPRKMEILGVDAVISGMGC